MELHSNGEIKSGAKRNIHGAEIATAAKPTYRNITNAVIIKWRKEYRDILLTNDRHMEQRGCKDYKMHNVLF